MDNEHCDHENKEWVPYFSGAKEEPASGPGWYCPDCDEWLGPEDEATMRGI